MSARAQLIVAAAERWVRALKACQQLGWTVGRLHELMRAEAELIRSVES